MDTVRYIIECDYGTDNNDVYNNVTVLMDNGYSEADSWKRISKNGSVASHSKRSKSLRVGRNS